MAASVPEHCGPPTVSVVLPIHDGVVPEHLDAALRGIEMQTRLPDEVVVVLDGPVSEDIRGTLGRYIPRIAQLIVRELPQNRGPGVANDVGLRVARSDWIAKVDADDISMPERLEQQLSYALQNRLDVCGAAMEEFSSQDGRVVGIRRGVGEHSAVVRAMRMNNPINHPACLFRRTLAIHAGGYDDLRFGEDYDLFARMLGCGARFGNMPDVLVRFRADDAMYKRRRITTIGRSEWRIQKNLYEYGVTTWRRRIFNLVVRLGYASLPTPLLKHWHRHVVSDH